MNAVNLYILCQGLALEDFNDYRKALTDSYNKKQEKKEEMKSLQCLVTELLEAGVEIAGMDDFFYGFSIPQISKEFDLLKIYEDGPIVNIELKSQEIEIERIQYQLEKNRYYLAHLNKKIYSFTYVENGGKGDVYTYDGEKLSRCELGDVIAVLNANAGRACVQKNIEKMFRAKDYLVSPVNTPDRFVDGRYYLTGQQEAIKKEILNSIDEGEHVLWGIQGGAGTGKTLLLYDIAKSLATDMRVCVIHSGILSHGHKVLNRKMSNVNIIPAKECNDIRLNSYDCILVDESQRLYQRDFDCVISAFQQAGKHCLFSYDYYQVLSYAEQDWNIPEQLHQLDNFCERKLSEKIRTNIEITSFIKNVIDLSNKPKRHMDYSNIDVLYASDYNVASQIVDYYTSDKGYEFISYTPSRVHSKIDKFNGYVNTHHVIGQEFDNVLFSMDRSFRYSDKGHLQGLAHPNPDYIFYKLWYQGVSRARERLCILIIDNEPLFDNIIKVKMQV